MSNSTIDPSFGDVSLHVVPVSRLVVDVVFLTITYWVTYRTKRTVPWVVCHLLLLVRYLIAFGAYYQDYDQIDGAFGRSTVWSDVDTRPLMWSDFVYNGLPLYGLYSKATVLLVVCVVRCYSELTTCVTTRRGIATTQFVFGLSLMTFAMYWAVVTTIPSRCMSGLQLVPRYHQYIAVGANIVPFGLIPLLNYWYLRSRSPWIDNARRHRLEVVNLEPEDDAGAGAVAGAVAVPVTDPDHEDLQDVPLGDVIGSPAPEPVAVSITETSPLAPSEPAPEVADPNFGFGVRFMVLFLLPSLFELFLTWNFAHAKGLGMWDGPARSFDPSLLADLVARRTPIRFLAIIF